MNEMVIGRDEGEVGIDRKPVVAREHLDIEMKMGGGAVGTIQIIRNDADFFAFADVASVQNAVGIHAPWIHMHIAKADMFVARVDLQRRRLLLRRADQYAIADGNNRLVVGIAAVGALVTPRTCRAHILPLMSETARTPSHAQTAGLAKIILPWIAGISASRLDWRERPVDRSASAK